MKNKYHNDQRILKICYLLLSDTIDRIDTILLELRHLQRNLIYFMHEPAFNAPLRFEEEFLWENEHELLRSFDDESVIYENILLFPEKRAPLEITEVKDFYKRSSHILERIYFYAEGNSHDKNKGKWIANINRDDISFLKEISDSHIHEKINIIENDIDLLINIEIDKIPEKIWKALRSVTAFIINENIKYRVFYLNKEEWMIRHGRNYDNLRGTQILKRLIVMDKVKILHFAMNNAGILPGNNSEATINPAGLAKFVILRNAVHKRCAQYLARILEYQSLFSKALDIGVKDFPVPLLERRREIGIYMEFLQDRVRAIRDEIKLLLEKLNVHTREKENYIILHSWTHHYTSEHHSHRYQLDKGKYDDYHVYHIVTSYWMPERDDLQPMIAHEIAHLILKEHCDSLSDGFLQGDDGGQFADLIRSINTVLNYYSGYGLNGYQISLLCQKFCMYKFNKLN